MNSCIFCNFCVSLHLFEDFQHLLFPYIFSKQKGGIIFTQNFAICLIKRTVVSFPLSPYCHKELLVGFVSYIDNQHPRLQRLYAFFLRMLGFYSYPSPQHICSLYSYFLQMEGSVAIKCPASTPVFLSLHTQTQITGRNLKNLYRQFCKHSPICINRMVLLAISARKWREIRDPCSSQIWAKVATCLHCRGGALCPSFSKIIGVWSKGGQMSRCCLPVLLFLRSD